MQEGRVITSPFAQLFPIRVGLPIHGAAHGLAPRKSNVHSQASPLSPQGEGDGKDRSLTRDAPAASLKLTILTRVACFPDSVAILV